MSKFRSFSLIYYYCCCFGVCVSLSVGHLCDLREWVVLFCVINFNLIVCLIIIWTILRSMIHSIMNWIHWLWVATISVGRFLWIDCKRKKRVNFKKRFKKKVFFICVSCIILSLESHKNLQRRKIQFHNKPQAVVNHTVFTEVENVFVFIFIFSSSGQKFHYSVCLIIWMRSFIYAVHFGKRKRKNRKDVKPKYH